MMGIAMKRLEGKVAVIFGAGPNIGGTIAHFMAREGARIVVSDIDAGTASETVAFLKSKGAEATALPGNATRSDEVAGIIAETVRRCGPPDVVVNTVGDVRWGSVLDIEPRDWMDCLTSFPTAGLFTTKHAAKAMIAAGKGGSVIQLLSTAAHFGEAGAAAYCAAKAALLNFARAAAMDLAHLGIRVNTITPCGMEHNLWGAMRDEIFDPNWQAPQRRSFYSRDNYLRNIPLGRFPRASDLAWASVFLASDESSFITGADIPVDGGLRVKYPTWRPGDHSGINIRDYVRAIEKTEYGEDKGKLIDNPASGASG
jgi:NAD(P)-dependent dehydrogenase (short-subunit alcohol dehydrogenase family)